jgi:hypothetical protein
VQLGPSQFALLAVYYKADQIKKHDKSLACGTCVGEEKFIPVLGGEA